MTITRWIFKPLQGLKTIPHGPHWLQVTQEASGNIWTPTIIFSNSPLSDQTIVDRQVEISNLARQTILDSKAVLTVVKKAGAIPAPPEEAVEVLNRNSFSILSFWFYPSRLSVSSRWLTTVEQKIQSYTQGSSRIHLPVSSTSRNTHLTPRLSDSNSNLSSNLL